MPTELNRDEVQRLLDASAQLVDVLSPQEYETEHIAGAVNIPLRRLDRESTSGLDRERPVIVYCHDLQ